MRMPAEQAWNTVRYGPLLRAAARSASAGRAYAALVARVEYARDRERRRVAAQRIQRWTGAPEAEARRTYLRALRSEALEEADSVRFMRAPRFPRDRVVVSGVEPRGARPRIYGALHLGSPVLAYLGLCLGAEAGLPLIARELDEDNRMPAPKQAYGMRKVAWVESTAGVKFLGTDAHAVLRARERLVDGGAICAAADVPGDVVTHRATMTVCGERLSFASGIFRLAVMTGADLQLVASCNRGGTIHVTCRPPVSAASESELAALVADEMAAVVRELPDEWWLWPFLLPATGR
jgi:hypothetical protein